MTLKNIGLSPTCFPSSTAAHDSEHRCSKAPCSLACWSLWSPKGRAGRQAHSITRGRTEGCGKWAGRNGNSIQGHVLTWSPIWDCTCLDLLRSLHRMPQAPPLQGGEGSIWVLLSPPWACSTGHRLCVSTCGACGHLTVPRAWSPGHEAREPGPGNDPKTSPKSLPMCCRVFSTLLSKPPSEDFPQCL